MAYRFMYLPSLGICLLAGSIFEKTYVKFERNKLVRVCLIVAGIAVLLFFS